MTGHTWRIISDLPFDYEGMEHYLESMAGKGWILESIGSWLLKFRRSEPRELKYNLQYLKDFSMSDPEFDEGLAEYNELCRSSGWEWVASRGALHIYVSKEADPVPMDTDPGIKLECIKGSMRNALLFPLILFVILGVMIYSLGQDGIDLEVLSSNLYLATIFAFGLSVIMTIVNSVQYLVWLRKSSESVKLGGDLLPTMKYGKYQRLGTLLYLISFIPYIFSVYLNPDTGRSVTPYILTLAAVLGFSAVMFAAFEYIKEKAGVRTGWKPAINILATALVIAGVAALLAFDPFRSGILSPGEGAKASDLTITSKDYRDTGSTKYDYTFRKSSSVLLGYECGEEEESSNELGYTLSYSITRVKKGWLYDRVVETLIKKHSDPSYVKYAGGEKNEMKKVSEPEWKAGTVYREFFAGKPSDGWIICYEDHIVDLEVMWEDGVKKADMEKMGKVLFRA